ncbi:MAG: lysylphosphatidylglycerol synthase transmembrane domain-containing protein [Ferruginibacter sp.]
MLFVVLCWSMYRQVSRQTDLEQRWQQIKQCWYNPLFWLVVVLMFFNWALEAKKWKVLIEPLQKLSLLAAFKAVMAGCSITMLTPNRIGEYGGRIMYVKENFRLQAISLTILGSISQLMVTLLAGTAGLIILQYYSANDAGTFKMLPVLFSNTLLAISIFFTLGLILVYLRISFIITLMKMVGFLKKILKHVFVLEQFSRKQLLRIFVLSLIRYLVFILQYMLLLHVMDVSVNPFLCFWLLSVFYLIMVLAPTIGFTELPVRATASVQLFTLYSTNIIGIQAAALGIWLINLVIPAILGSFLILGIKINKENENSIP